jgi:mono/diheme cytochrome c family protein
MKAAFTLRRSRWGLRAVVGLLVLGLAVALFYGDLLAAAVAPNPYAGSVESIARGTVLWSRHCAVCHGPEGRGDGPVAPSLRKKPKDLTRIATPPVFPDGVVAYRIAHGGEAMPAWADALTEQEIWDLVSYVRAQRQR